MGVNDLPKLAEAIIALCVLAAGLATQVSTKGRRRRQQLTQARAEADDAAGHAFELRHIVRDHNEAEHPTGSGQVDLPPLPSSLTRDE